MFNASLELPARFATLDVPVRINAGPLSIKLFVKFLAKLHEIFGDAECGLCKSKEVYFATAGKGGTMVRLQCANDKCKAQLDIGTAKDENSHEIWAKRWSKETGALPNRGWHIYTPDGAPAGVGDAHEGPVNGDPDIGSVPF